MLADRAPRAGNLTAALVMVAAGELVLNRVVGRLFLNHASTSPAGRLVVHSAPFLFHLAGVLALGVLVFGVLRAIRRRELFVPGMRVSLAVIGAVFAFLCGWGVVAARLPDRFFVHLHTSYAFLSLLIVAAFLRGAVPWRIKLGLFSFALPGILHAVALFLDRMSWFKGGATVLNDLTGAGQAAALGAASFAPLLLPPAASSTRRLLAAAAAGAVVATVIVAAVVWNFDLVQSVALYGFRLDIPSPPGARTFAYVIAAFGLTVAAVQLLAVPGGPRLMGYGLCALGIAGYQLASPYELALALCGLLALALGGLRASPSVEGSLPRFSDGDWRAFISRLATAAQTALPDAEAPAPPPEAVVVHDDDVEVTRVRCSRGGRPVSLRVRRRRGAVIEFEAVIGEPGRGEPDAAFVMRGAEYPKLWGPRPAAPRVETGDPDFDRRFWFAGDLAMADETTRLRLLQHTAGVVAVWRGRAVRYRAVPGRPAPADHPVPPSLDPKPALDLLDALGAMPGEPTP